VGRGFNLMIAAGGAGDMVSVAVGASGKLLDAGATRVVEAAITAGEAGVAGCEARSSPA
jgi:hypothetical protein